MVWHDFKKWNKKFQAVNGYVISGLQLGNQLILFRPQVVKPILKLPAKIPVTNIITLQSLRDRKLPHPHFDFADIAAQIIPKAFFALRVNNGHVYQAVNSAIHG